MLESAAVAILIDEVVVVGSLEDLDKADDVGGVFDLGECLYLIDGELFELGTQLELLHLDDLDGHHLS